MHSIGTSFYQGSMLVNAGIQLAPPSPGSGEAPALPGNALSANSPFTFAEVCALQLSSVPPTEAENPIPAASENASPQLDGNTELTLPPNPKSAARSNSALPDSISFFPFLPVQVAVPLPDAIKLPSLPLQGDASPGPTDVAETPSNPQLQSIPTSGTSANLESTSFPNSYFSQSVGETPAAAPLSPTNVDSNVSPSPTVPDPAAIENVSNIAAIENEAPQPTSPQLSACDPLNSQPSPAPLTATVQSTNDLPVAQSLSLSDSICCVSFSPAPTSSGTLNSSVRNDGITALQTSPSALNIQVAVGTAAQNVAPANDSSPSGSPNSLPAEPTQSAAKTIFDSRGKDLNPDAPRPKIREAPFSTADAVPTPPPPSVQGLQEPLLPDAPPMPIQVLRAVPGISSTVASAAPSFVAPTAPPLAQNPQATSRSDGQDTSASSSPSPTSTAPVTISVKNSQAGNSGDDSHDSPQRKDPAPQATAAPSQPSLSTPQIVSDPAVQGLMGQSPAAPAPTPEPHAVLPGAAQNFSPEAPHPPSPPGPVQVAQIVSKAAQSEMRIGLNTSAFGSVEVRTLVHANDVGIQIGSERGDLRTLLSNDIPAIASSLQRQDLHLAQVSFHQQGFAFSSDASSGGNAQPRWFASKPNSLGAQNNELPVPEATASAEPSHPPGAGLSILA